MKCLGDDVHERQVYQLSEPELRSICDIADRLSRAIGVPIEYNDMPPEEFKQLSMSMGGPLWRAENVTLVQKRRVALDERGMPGWRTGLQPLPNERRHYAGP